MTRFLCTGDLHLGKGSQYADDRLADQRGVWERILELADTEGCDAVLVDDFTVSAGTLVNAAEQLVQRGARSVWAAVTHAVFAGNAMERLESSHIQRLIVTDTIETQPVAAGPKVEVVSVAPLFAEAIGRIHNRESISVLFES